jgi:hypothetical protein
MVQHVSGNGNRFYYYADALGSIRLLSDSAGNIKETIRMIHMTGRG